MTKEDFIKEVKSSDICPKNFDKIYKEFNYYQDQAYETLLEFHRVCESNSINYQLAFGSLLGFIRDGGQIPWDYDVDVIVPYKEKKKLIEALNNDLKDDYYYYSIENNSKCRHMIMRLAPKNFKTESLHVDVFFVIGTPNNEQERINFRKKVLELSRIRFYKKVSILENYNGSIKKLIKLVLYKIKYAFVSGKKAMKQYDRLCNMYEVEESIINIPADMFATECAIESKFLWKTKISVDNMGNELRIPVHYKELLNNEYGDYKKIFPLKDRLSEMLKHYYKLHKQNYKNN